MYNNIISKKAIEQEQDELTQYIEDLDKLDLNDKGDINDIRHELIDIAMHYAPKRIFSILKCIAKSDLYELDWYKQECVSLADKIVEMGLFQSKEEAIKFIQDEKVKLNDELVASEDVDIEVFSDDIQKIEIGGEWIK